MGYLPYSQARRMRWYWNGGGKEEGVVLEMMLVHEDVGVALFPRRPGDKAGKRVQYE